MIDCKPRRCRSVPSAPNTRNNCHVHIADSTPQSKVKQLQCGSARSAESRTCQARNGVSSAIDRYADRLMFTLWIVSKMKNGGEGCSRFRVHSLLVFNLFVSTFQFLDQRASLRRHKREYRRTIAYSKVYRSNPCVPCSSDLIFKSH